MWPSNLLSMVIVFGFGSVVVSQSVPEDKPETIEDLIAILVQYEASYFGRVVETNSSRLTEGKVYQRFWFSRDGEVQVCEHTIVSEQGGNTSEQRSGIHNTADFSLSATQRLNNGEAGVVGLTAVPERYPDQVGTMFDSILFGYIDRDAVRFSEICRMEGALLEMTQLQYDGERLIGLSCNVPQLGRYVFGFGHVDNDYRLRYVHVLKEPGDVIVKKEGTFSLLESGNREPVIGSNQSRYSRLEAIYYPIEYDGRFPVKYANPLWSSTAADGDRDFSGPGFSVEVLSHAPLDRRVRPNDIWFSHLEMPASADVQMFRTGVPMRFKNGQLIVLVDGRSVDLVGGVGYRVQPWTSTWSFFVFILALILVLCAGGYKLWLVRAQR